MTPFNPLRRRGFLKGLSATTSVALLSGTGLLSGCLGSSTPPPRQFYLSALDKPSPGLPEVDWSLVVEPPQTVPALRTKRIVLAFTPNEFGYYAGVEWGDLPASMAQGAIIRSFRTSGAIDVVANERQGIRPDYMLKSWLVPFYAEGEKGAAPLVKIGLDVQLMKMRDRKIVATNAFSHAIQASSPKIEDIVQAFDQAMTNILTDVVPWALLSGEKG
ncbi:MAG: ABC-type transport auxiliary lipoprotein family protein [Geminicoccaceae bacterium]